MTFRFAVLAAFLAAVSGAPANAQSADASGTWLTQAGDARVKISKCCVGALCGGETWTRAGR